MALIFIPNLTCTHLYFFDIFHSVHFQPTLRETKTANGHAYNTEKKSPGDAGNGGMFGTAYERAISSTDLLEFTDKVVRAATLLTKKGDAMATGLTDAEARSAATLAKSLVKVMVVSQSQMKEIAVCIALYSSIKTSH